MSNKYRSLIIALIFIAATTTAYYFYQPQNTIQEAYDPQINPQEFSTEITNKYFSLPVGKKFVYESRSADGAERVEITVPGDIKKIMGVQTLVYMDKVYLDGQLVEDTRDYLAQDIEGNVWYFGENVENYEDGRLKDHKGSWIAGVDGAQPGIWMTASPMVGDSYRQEYYKGVAEDMADVLSTSETVTTKKATYHNCVKTFDYTPLEPSVKELKYYCPEVATLVLERDPATDERLELVE